MDVVDRQLIPLALASTLFEYFAQQLTQQCPIVAFPRSTSIGKIRYSKPTLFLAAITAAAGASHPDLYHVLSRETSKILADRVIVRGEKTLELVQAILISAMWNYPSENFKELKFNQWIHLAATMALDLDLDRISGDLSPDGILETSDAIDSSKSNSPKGKLGFVGDDDIDTDLVDRCRTFLGCYLSCAG